jgi:hypothetical protein
MRRPTRLSLARLAILLAALAVFVACGVVWAARL